MSDRSAPRADASAAGSEGQASEDVTLEMFMSMDEDARAKLPKTRLKKLNKLEEGWKKKQAKASANSGAASAAKENGKAKEKKSSKSTAPVTLEQLIETPKGEYKRLTTEMAAAYNPAHVEHAWYDWWEAKGYFKANSAEAAKAAFDDRFVMVIPPPNVTGSLHLGHTLMCAIEDALTRWHRMCGRPALWLPGVDHAGIATQTVVEKKLMREQGLSRHDLGRDAFVSEVWKWKNDYGVKIWNQLRRIGSSVDWTREEFTMSDKLSTAVKEAFVRMYDMGLIYRDTRLVNWCCKLRTALSDIEVDYVDIPGKQLMKVPDYDSEVEFGVLTKFSYKLEGDSTVELVIATTRLETMLGDVAVAVHPDDPRYKSLIGKHLAHPFVDRKIPIIADSELVDMEFGTGAVKITPAHDPNDFACGRRHGLPEINVMDTAGCMNENAGMFAGMARYVARREIEAELKKIGQFCGKEDNAMRLGVCSRSGDVIEPMLMPQWYVSCKEMGAAGARAVRDGELEIIPDMFKETWFYWMDNIRDWCISRQLWWGHRIPAYRVIPRASLALQEEVWVVGRNEAEATERACKQLSVTASEITLEQDNDVLDTWFSSGLFPFSVFGWPDEDTEEFRAFFPNSVLETGHDILFFWVARMVMMSQTLTGKLPFKKVLLHAMVRDKYGRKMSKSLGNIIDPLEVIDGASLQQLLDKLSSGNVDPKEMEKASAAQREDFPAGIPECGADALRYGLIAYTQQARNMNLDVARVIGYRNFCNKLWNATRFALSNLGSEFEFSSEGLHRAISDAAVHDMWILAKLSNASAVCNQSFETFQLADVVTATYNFWLYDLCDVYLETIKPIMSNDSDPSTRSNAQFVLYHCLHTGLRLLHPIMPFVSEELFQRLPNRRAAEPHVESIMMAEYPKEFAEGSQYDDALLQVDQAMRCVKAIRALRAMYGLKSSLRLPVYVVCRNERALSDAMVAKAMIKSLSGASEMSILEYGASEPPQGCGVSVVDDFCDVAVHLKGSVDFEAELKRLNGNAEEKRIVIQKYTEKMQAPGYEEKVPENVRARTAELIAKSQQELNSILEMADKFSKLVHD